jgi:hypothetical protein
MPSKQSLDMVLAVAPGWLSNAFADANRGAAVGKILSRRWIRNLTPRHSRKPAEAPPEFDRHKAGRPACLLPLIPVTRVFHGPQINHHPCSLPGRVLSGAAAREQNLSAQADSGRVDE